MDVIRDLIQTSNASRSKVRIVNNNGIFGVVATNETTPTLPTEIAAPSAMPTAISVAGATSGTIGTTERIISFPYSGSAATKDYSFTTTENLVCDILVVGGGGAGSGTIGGGGGAGALIFARNATLSNGTYTISVGNGGTGGSTGQGTKGNSSSISKDGINITAEGGGASGRGDGNQNGGSGGGGDYWEGNQTRGTSTSYTSTAFGASIVKYGNNGANAYTPSPFNGGGGGGAGSSALIATSTNLFSNGGIGLHQVIIDGTTINFATIFGTNTAQVGGVLSNGNLYYGGGGGGGGNETSLGGSGGIGGGGNGGTGSSGSIPPYIPIHGSNGFPNTGGGGGGGSNHPSLGGSGGSGIVIIRYRKPSSEIVVSSTIDGTTDRLISFPYTGTGATKDYTITTTEALSCDILVVGGGGSGGRSGGGGGAVLYTQNVYFPTGGYTLKVGNGGISTKTGYGYANVGIDGNDSEIVFGGITIFRAKGGGGGGLNDNTAGRTGGSSGGGESSSSTPSSLNIISTNTSSSTFTTLTNQSPNGSTIRGNIGGIGFTTSAGATGNNYMGGGGGGAGGAGGTGNTITSGAGGSGINNSITNTTIMYGSGGSSGVYNQLFGASITIAGAVTSGGGTGAYSTSSSGTGVAAGATISGTGGGGGGGTASGSVQFYPSDGGSGIIIIRYRKATNTVSNTLFSISNGGVISTSTNVYSNVIINYVDSSNVSSGTSSTGISSQWTTSGTNIYYNTSNVGIGTTDPVAPLHIYNNTTNRLLLDTTTTGTPSIEFRRGVGADMQNDFRIINDTSPANGTIKLLCENSTQSFNDTTANLAWFSSNETIIHKNTSMNGRVGIGTTYHSTRRLDVLGDANVSGAVSLGGLSVSSSGSSGVTAIISNSLTSNTSLTIRNGMIPPTITSSPVATTTGTTGDFTYQVFTYTTETAGAGTGQSLYTLTVGAGGAVCDILIVGGGGGGGMQIGAGGGGGAVLYGTNISIIQGTYTIKVGRGATPGETIGKSTEGFGATILGGGCAGNANWGANPTTANSGGSGAGGKAYWGVGSSASTLVAGGVGVSTKGTILTTATLYNGNVGGTAVQQVGGNPIQSAGGGGAGAVGGNGNGSGSQTGNGGAGVLVNITGINYYWGGGGGGGNYQSTSTNGGRGGGGAGERNDGGGSLGFGTGGADAYNAPVNMNGGAGSGGGGGGGGYGTATAGNGGSGIIIIRYLTSTSSSIELIRGTAGDANRDYKLGNYNAEFKVLSSVSNTDTDYIKITTAGAITNPTGTASWNTGSDRRIKENIERASYDKCYDNINRLELNRFNYIDGFNTVSRDRAQLGFIAQEVKDIFPKSISTQGYYSDSLNIPDLLSIDISQINYSLYGAVKKLIELNKEDKEKLASLDNRIKTITNFLNISLDTSNLLDTSNITIDTSNIAIDTSNLLETSNITIDTSNLLDTSNIAIDTRNIAIDTSNLLDTSNITIDTSNLLDTSNIAIDTSNILDTSNITIDTSNLLDTSNISTD